MCVCVMYVYIYMSIVGSKFIQCINGMKHFLNVYNFNGAFSSISLYELFLSI